MSGTVVHGAILWVIQGELTPGWQQPVVSVEGTSRLTKCISRTTLRCAAKICSDQGLTGGIVHGDKLQS